MSELMILLVRQNFSWIHGALCHVSSISLFMVQHTTLGFQSGLVPISMISPTWIYVLKRWKGNVFVFLMIFQPFVSCILLKQIPKDGLIISHGAFQSLTHLQFYNVDGPGLVFEGVM